MGRKISISQLSAAVMEQLNEYAELATEDMKEAVKKAGTAVRKDIEASAPRNTGDYAKSWAVKTTGNRAFTEPVSACSSAGVWPCEAWRWPGSCKAPHCCCGRGWN